MNYFLVLGWKRGMEEGRGRGDEGERDILMFTYA
jgi:hypothetical protein